MKNILEAELLPPIEDYAGNLNGILIEKYQKVRDGIHASTGLYCPRQAATQLVYPKKWKINARTAHNFGDGDAIHALYERLFDEENPNRYELENKQTIEGYGYIYTPDLYDTWTNTVIDIKTSRPKSKFYKPFTEPYAGNLAQLQFYMALKNADFGVLLYHILTRSQEDPLLQWSVVVNNTKKPIDYNNRIITTTRQELESIKQLRIHELKHEVEQNVIDKTPKKAYPKPAMEILNADENDPNGRFTIANPEYGWMCDDDYCPFVNLIDCKEGYNARQKKIRVRTENKDARLARGLKR